MEIMLCWKRLFTTRAWHGYSFGRLRGNRDQYCELFLRETLVRELNFKKSLAGPGAPRRFNGQNRTWSWGIFLDLRDVRGISREWLCDFYPCFKSIILWFGLVPFISQCFLVIFFFLWCVCHPFVMTDVQDFLDPALDASPLKISAHLQWIFTIMITACLELLSLTEIYYSWIGCYCSVIYGWLFWSPTSLCLFSFECW